MTTLFIMLMVLLLSLFWVYKSDQNHWEDGHFVSIVLSTMIFIALILTSIEKDVKSEWIETKVEVRKTTNYVFVDSGDDYHIFKEIKDYNSINDSTVFYKEHTVNFWGVKDVEDIKYEN